MVAAALCSALFAVGAAPALAAPDVRLNKTPDGKVIKPGGTATFTIVLSNPGPGDAFNVELEDFLPMTDSIIWDIDSQTLFFGCGVEVDPPNVQVLRCDVGTLSSGQTEKVVVSGVTPDTGCLVLSNTATVDYDDHAPVSDSGLITTKCAGRMTGGGSIFTGANVRVTHGFEIRCDATDRRQNLEINWPGVKNQNNFHLTSLTSATCVDDPLVSPQPPKAGFDTFIGEGVGTCNGQPAAIRFVFTDAGEPGTSDTAEYHISGACTLDTPPTVLTNGNQQAHSN